MSDKLDRQAAREQFKRWANIWVSNPIAIRQINTLFGQCHDELEAQDVTIASQETKIHSLKWCIETAGTISRAQGEKIASLESELASQSAEIAELKRVDLIRRQTFVADAKQWAGAMHQKDQEIHGMREALEKAPHGEKCILPWKHICNCWKSAALAQVSASQVQTEEKTR